MGPKAPIRQGLGELSWVLGVDLIALRKGCRTFCSKRLYMKIEM